jgi:8-oxo-dGTP pyrophosphatase MutT (NUDIX family)
MSEERAKAIAAGFENTVARVAVVVNEKHRRRDVDRQAVTQVYRPWWSKFEPNTWSMMGGKVNDEDLPSDREYTDTDFEYVARRTAVREAYAELGIFLAIEDLIYVGLFNNGEWATALFYVLTEERPEVTVNTDEIDGYRWEDIEKAATNKDTFADHKQMYQAIMDDMTKRAA